MEVLTQTSKTDCAEPVMEHDMSHARYVSCWWEAHLTPAAPRLTPLMATSRSCISLLVRVPVLSLKI